MKVFKILVVFLLIFWFSLFFLKQIDLTTADLGRHIKNGEMVLKGEFEVLKTNFYSYTNKDYPFVNHHWLTGVIFYIIHRSSSFIGLSLFYILLFFITFGIFFKIAKDKNNFWIAAILSFALIPLITDRQEIRPEIFTYLFSGIFLFILCHPEPRLKGGVKDPVETELAVNISKKKKNFLWLLPILMLLWVNLHIGFVFGILLIGAFLLEAIIKKQKSKIRKLFIILIFTCLVTLINPFGIQGALQPLTIFKEYGYDIVENKSIWFLENYGIFNPNFLLVKILIVILLISFILLFIFKRKSFSISYFLLSLVFGVMSYLAVRNFSHFGLISLPILALNVKEVMGGLKDKFDKWYVNYVFIILGIIILSIVFIYNYDYLIIKMKNFGLGLSADSNTSIEFFKANKIQGPIFNNYDIGSYLIFHLFPQERVFVDNRPETYPVSFFKDEYMPMQEDNDKWNELDEKYNFNVIFFARHDLTPWAQAFLIERVQDNEWAPVFYDDYSIIFIKRVDENKDIIEKYEIPKNNFSVRN